MTWPTTAPKRRVLIQETRPPARWTPSRARNTHTRPPGSTLPVESPPDTPISPCTASRSTSRLKRIPTPLRTTLVDCSSGLRGARSHTSWMRVLHRRNPRVGLQHDGIELVLEPPEQVDGHRRA